MKVIQPYDDSFGPEAVEFIKQAGLEPFLWQEDLIDISLGFDEDGRWTSRNMGIVIPRQNGKSEFAVARILIGLFLVPGEDLIIYCAHEAATAREIHNRLASIIEEPGNEWMAKRVKHIYRGNDYRAIEMRNGKRVIFKTRTKGATRGFSCDLLILDEAMILSHEFAQAVLPTQFARKNPQTIVMGSAGIGEASEYFGLMRERSLGAKEDDDLSAKTTWIEWSADVCNDYCEPGCTDHDDPTSYETFEKCNPSYGMTIDYNELINALNSMGQAQFCVEALSVGDWPTEIDEFSVITREEWEASEDSSLVPRNPVVFAVAVSQDRTMSTIVAAGHTDVERTMTLVEITGDEEGDGMDCRPGTQWVVPRVVELWERHKPYAIVIDSKAQASTFIEVLERKGINVISPTAVEYATACGAFKQGITGTKNEPRHIFHLGQPDMTLAVAGADKRDLAHTWAWARATPASNITSLEAATLANWGLIKESAEAAVGRVWVV